MIGRLDDHLVSAHAVHAVVEPLAGRLELALDAQRRELVRRRRGTTSRASSPASPGGRPTRISGGVLSSLPGQNTQLPPCATTGSVVKSDGRRARSVEMMTHRPTTGSFRRSGIGVPPRRRPPASPRARAARPAPRPAACRRRARPRPPSRSAASCRAARPAPARRVRSARPRPPCAWPAGRPRGARRAPAPCRARGCATASRWTSARGRRARPAPPASPARRRA